MPGSVFAISDIHNSYSENWRIVEALHPETSDDWLIVAGDVSNTFARVERALRMLRQRYAKVIWAPGNHDLWTTVGDSVQLRGEARYDALVKMCQDNDTAWAGPTGPVTIAPLFQYDYSWLAPGTSTKKESLEYAFRTGVVCADEIMLRPEPYPTCASWCDARINESEHRLSAISSDTKTLLVSHWPFLRQLTERLRFPEFAQWYGTIRAADWPSRFRAEVAVYGHLHIPRTSHHDGVRFEEVSLGYPSEWSKRGKPLMVPKKVLPA